MDADHVDVEVKKNDNLRSIFSLFDNIIGEDSKNGKHCAFLIDLLNKSDVSIGTTTNLRYSIKRLIRGLGSARLNTQCGCFATLTSIFKYHQVPIDEVLEILENEEEEAGKSDEMAYKKSCIFTCGSVIHSGLYATLSTEKKQVIIERLIAAGKAKNYLTFCSYIFVADAVGACSSQEFKSVVWSICKKNLKRSLDEASIDELYFLLFCHGKHKKTISKFIEKHLTSIDMVIEKVVSTLLNSNVRHDHPVYDCVSQLLSENKKLLLKLWPKCLNKEAKVSAFKDGTLVMMIFCLFKYLKDPTIIPKLLTPQFLDTLIRVLSFDSKKKSANDAFSMGKSVLDSVVNLLSREDVTDATRMKTIEKLIFYPGNMKFEKKTGTKCVHLLILRLGAKALKQLSNKFQAVISGQMKKQIDDQGTMEDWNSKEKQFFLHSYVRLILHSSLKNEKSWKLEQIMFIFDIAFIEPSKVSTDIRKCAKECFYHAIEVKMSSLEDLLSLLNDFVIFTDEKIKNKLVQLSENAVVSWNKMLSAVKKMKKKSNKMFIAVHLLLIHMGFQLFTDSALAESSIDELLSCYSRLKEKHDKEDEPHWTEVTVDLMLSLLSRENRLWRKVVSSAFAQVAAVMTSNALHQIIDALGLQSDALKKDGDSDSELDEAEEEESESSMSEGSDIDDAEEEDKANDQLRMAVRNALGYSAALTDDESVDMDDMKPDEEERLNKSLGEAFKIFRSNSHGKKKKQTKEDATLMHFRTRILDLIEIYVSGSPSVAGCLDLLLPLFELFETTIKDAHQKPLQSRLENVLKKIAAVTKFANAENVTHQIIVDVFKAIVERKEVPGLVYVEMAPRIVDCCTFLMRCSQLLEEEEAPLVEEYFALLNGFFLSKSTRLPVTVFQSVLKAVWVGNWKIAGKLYEFLTNDGLKLFYKIQVVDLLLIFYQNDKLHATAKPQAKKRLNKLESNFISKLQLEGGLEAKNNQTFYTKLLKLITTAHFSYEKHRKDSDNKPQWKDLVSKLAQSEGSQQKLRSQLVHLIKLFDVAMPDWQEIRKRNRKRTLSSSSHEEKQAPELTNGKSKKKKKKSKNMKLKKESAKMREAVSSAGMEDIPFSAMDVETLPEAEVDDVEDKNDSRQDLSLNGETGSVKKVKRRKLKF